MTSARKKEINRANAQASTGPKTAHGRARAAQNARRHGLSILVISDPAYAKDVLALANDICGDDAPLEIQDAARHIAEAQLDLIRIRRARYELISRDLNEPYYMPKAASRQRTKLIIAALRACDRGKEIPDEVMEAIDAKPDVSHNLLVILSELSGKIVAMDRYERRALSRRKFAIRAFDAARREAGSRDSRK